MPTRCNSFSARSMGGSLYHILQDGHRGPKVELLEYHGQFGSDSFHLSSIPGNALSRPLLAHFDQFAMHVDFS
jgi:hypothetical protein